MSPRRASAAAAAEPPNVREVSETPRPPVESSQIPLRDIIESPLNPRKHRAKDTDFDDLVKSVRQHGIIEPLVVRVSPFEFAKFEIVAGSRRKRAAEAARLLDVPCSVRDVTDLQLLELALAENVHRQAMHPLDEAHALQRLQDLDATYRDNRVLASQVGRSETYVRDRLKLLTLDQVVIDALDHEAITAKHAERIARLPKDQHTAALKACFSSLFVNGTEIDDLMAAGKWEEVATALGTLSDFDEWAESHAKVDLADPDLQEKFPELAVVTNDDAEDGDQTTPSLLQLSEEVNLQRAEAQALHVIPSHSWKEVKSERNRCDYTTRGAVVHGGKLRIIDVCARRACSKHFPKPTAAAREKAKPYDYEAENKKREEAQAKWDAQFTRYAPLLVTHLRAQKLKVSTALVRLAFDVFGENHLLRQVKDEFSVELGDDTIALFLALAIVARRRFDRATFLGIAKPFKFDVAKADRELAKAEKTPGKAAKNTAAPKKAKKGGKKR